MPKPCVNRPDNVELQRLYVVENMTAKDIADKVGVEKITALRWLKAAGVERRKPGVLARRGIDRPSAEDLRRWVHDQHRAYRDIASELDVDPSTIMNWLTDYGIAKPTVWETRRGGVTPPEPTPDELRSLIAEGVPLRDIGALFSVSRMTIRNRCRRYGIEVPSDGWRGDNRLTCIDGHEVRSIYEQRVDNWLQKHGVPHELEPAYPWDRRYRADFLARGMYIEVWGVSNNAAYEERKALKIQQCKDSGVPLVQVNYWQFAQGRKWWRPLQRLADN